MSNEKQTRIKPALPEGDVTVLVQVANLAEPGYNAQHASFLQEVLAAQRAESTDSTADPQRITEADGMIYAEFATHGLDTEAAVARTAALLHRGLGHIVFETAEVYAQADSTVEVSPDRPISESFRYLKEDVTLELRNSLQDLSYETAAADTLDAELYLLLNA